MTLRTGNIRGVRVVHGAIAGGAVAFAAACADQMPAGPRAPTFDVGAAREGQPGNDRAHPGEAHLRQLARQVPGFGGISYDRASGGLLVYLTDPGRGEEARGVVTSYLARVARGLGRLPIVVRRGSYTFAQLDTWRNIAESAAPDIPGVNWVDLDESRNRVGLGVTTRGGMNAVATRLRAAGVPSDAVYFATSDPAITYGAESCTVDPVTDEIICNPVGYPEELYYSSEDPGPAPTAPGSCSPDRLDCYVRAPEAGRVVTFRDAAGTPLRCTLGFHGTDNTSGRNGFVTAAHCGSASIYAEGEMRSDPFYHLTPTVGYQIATEAIDPPMRNCSVYTSDPKYAGGECLRADAMFAAGTSNYISVPSIARPNQRVGPGTAAYDTSIARRVINTSNPRIVIDGARAPFMGEVVEKIGTSTGWTYGTLLKTCQTLYLGNSASRPTPYRYISCVATSDYGRSGGDSGGPVFALDAYYGTATILGVHHGAMGSETNPNQGGSFSDIEKIRERLGPISVAVTPF